MIISIWVLLGIVLAFGVCLGITIFLLKEIVRKEVRQEFEFSRAQMQEKAVADLERQKDAVQNSVQS